MTDIAVIGSLESDPRFNLSITQSDDFSGKPASELVHVAGMVRQHELGDWVTIWDAGGQVLIESKQSQPLRFGDQVEAIGYPYTLGVQQCLSGGLYRLRPSMNRTTSAQLHAPEKSLLHYSDISRRTFTTDLTGSTD